MADLRKEISFVYEKSKDAKTVPANGAYGGPTPDNSGVVIHFYLEYGSIPHSTDIPIEVGQTTADPKLGRNITRGDFTREIQSSIFMSAESAITIGKWLITRGEIIQAIKRGEIPPEE
ncbi:MAG: hypothetical protein ACYDA4_14505 [Ignavibacteriaceae bacterium]